MQNKLSGRRVEADPLDGIIGSKKHLSYFPTINSSLDRRSIIRKRSKNKHEFNPSLFEPNEAKIISKDSSLEEIYKLNSSFDTRVNYDKLMNFVNCY